MSPIALPSDVGLRVQSDPVVMMMPMMMMMMTSNGRFAVDREFIYVIFYMLFIYIYIYMYIISADP